MTKYREVLRLASLGLSQQSIADSYNASKKTVSPFPTYNLFPFHGINGYRIRSGLKSCGLTVNQLRRRSIHTEGDPLRGAPRPL